MNPGEHLDNGLSVIDTLLNGVIVLDCYIGSGRYRGIIFHEKDHLADVELAIQSVTRRRLTIDAKRAASTSSAKRT